MLLLIHALLLHDSAQSSQWWLEETKHRFSMAETNKYEANIIGFDSKNKNDAPNLPSPRSKNDDH